MNTKRICRIREQLEIIRHTQPISKDMSKRGFQLFPTITAEKLEDFEAKHDVRLPEEYRDFLLYLGNGGTGPSYGLFPLPVKDSDIDGILKNPSPLHPDMPDGDWHDVLGLEMDDESDFDPSYDGSMAIATRGCTYDILLIVSGTYRGRLVYIDRHQVFPPYFAQFPDFLSWYETWVCEALAGYDMGFFGYGLPLDVSDSVKVAVAETETLGRRVAALDNLWRAPAIPSEWVATLRAALACVHDYQLASPMLKVLSRHLPGERLGGAYMEWAEKSREGHAYSVVWAMKNAGLVDWVQGAHLVLKCDADPQSSQNLLYLLKRENVVDAQAVRLALASIDAQVISTGQYVNREIGSPSADSNLS